MTRVEYLEEIIVAEEKHTELVRHMDELSAQLRELNKTLPSQNSRKKSEVDRVSHYKIILAAECKRESVIAQLWANESRIKTLRHAARAQSSRRCAQG